MKRAGKVFLYIFLTVIVAAAFTTVLFYTNHYPAGSDVYGHLFKANVLYHAILDGKWYPIYTPYWYNSIELFRYWPPFSYYILAGLQFLCNGNVIQAFPLFGGVCFLISMMGWLCFGLKENRVTLAFVAGVLYFWFPDSLRVFFSEGNVPRIWISALLPLLFFCMWDFIEYKRKRAMMSFLVLLCAVTFTHIMISAMVGVSLFLFCLIHAIANKSWKYEAALVGEAILTYPAMGMILLPGLLGGLTGQSSEASIQTIQNWAQSASLSLNPVYRMESLDYFYFGLSVFVIMVLGIVALNRRTAPGFLSAFLIFISTTTAFTSIVRMLPMSQVWWMQRFVPMALCFFLMSFLFWKQLKKTVIVLFALCMAIDIAPSAWGFLGNVDAEPEVKQQRMADQNLLGEAAELAQNRVAILDNSMMGSFPSYYFSEKMDETALPYSFGWAYQGAATIKGIVSINEAIEYGFPAYAFDRLVELGNDVVILSKQHANIKEEDWDAVERAAEACGYEKVDENEENILYQLTQIPETGQFGTVTIYHNLAIGEEAQYICYLYPDYKYGHSNVIEDYSLEELCQYQKIYLSGFQYDDKEQAEKLLSQAAAKGVEIYIDMQHIPENKLTGKTEFMDVYAQFVQFTEKFPIMETANGSQFKLNFRTSGYDVWNTVYISGLDHVERQTQYDTKTNLAYWGYDQDENIHFIGFNPVYYYVNTKNPELLVFLQEMLGEEGGQLPERRMVPITVEYGYDEIHVQVPEDGVNTNIAALDCFFPDKILTTEDNLLVMGEGKTTLYVEYAGKRLGGLVSAVGCIVLAVYVVFIGVRLDERKERKA